MNMKKKYMLFSGSNDLTDSEQVEESHQHDNDSVISLSDDVYYVEKGLHSIVLAAISYFGDKVEKRFVGVHQNNDDSIFKVSESVVSLTG